MDDKELIARLKKQTRKQVEHIGRLTKQISETNEELELLSNTMLHVRALIRENNSVDTCPRCEQPIPYAEGFFSPFRCPSCNAKLRVYADAVGEFHDTPVSGIELDKDKE